VLEHKSEGAKKLCKEAMLFLVREVTNSGVLYKLTPIRDRSERNEQAIRNK